MKDNSKNRQVSDSLTLRNEVRVVRYKSSKAIKEMMEGGHYIEAFAHAQLGLEKILWDKIIGLFPAEKATIVRRSIDSGRDQRLYAGAFELIKWAYFLGAISDAEFNDLKEFNKKRNALVHTHGDWYYPKEYKEALVKVTRFLEESHF